MVGQATIGALRVDLGLNSAQFTTGLASASRGLNKFGVQMTLGLETIANAIGRVVGAIPDAVKASLDHADALSKSAQKAGVAVEALSRLEFAAKLSDVSLEGLTSGLQKLGKSMVEAVSTPTSTAATAFKALGIQLTDASGKLRDSDAVFADLADKFSHLEDGSTKTAIAMQVFGKSGADLIPLLNSGRQGLKDMADESDRLGLTISTKTAQAAEKFNDTLTRIQSVMEGVVNKVMEAALPALQSLADMLADPKFAQGAADLANLIINAVKDFLPYIYNAINNVTALRDLFVDLNNMSLKGLQNKIVDLQNEVATRENRIIETKARLAEGGAATLFGINNGALQGQIDSDIAAIQPLIDKIAEVQALIKGREFVPTTTPLVGGGDGGGGGGGGPLVDFGADIKAANDNLDPFAARIQELSGVLSATVDPFSQMKMDLTDLKTMFDNGRISAGQFGEAVTKTIVSAVGDFADLAGQALGSLSQIFKGNKALAVASAVVDGIGSVAKTFAQYGFTPWGIAAAGGAAIAAAANVASILSTTETTKSMPSGATGSSVSSAAAPQQQTSAINLTVSGSGMISVDDFASQLTQSIADGGNQNLVKVIRSA